MSHPVNDEILERLYEEALDELSLKKSSYWLSFKKDITKEFVQELAVELARKRFEELPEPLDLE